MMYLVIFICGFIFGFMTVCLFNVSRDEEYQADLDNAIREAYWEGYEQAMKELEK